MPTLSNAFIKGLNKALGSTLLALLVGAANLSAQNAYVVGSDDGYRVFSFSRNPSTGELAPVGTPAPTQERPIQVLVHPWNSIAYVSNQDSNSITTYRISGVDGSLTYTGNATQVPAQLLRFTLDPVGRFLYTISQGSDEDSLSTYVLDDQGEPRLAGTATFNFSRDLVIEPSGRFAFLTTGRLEGLQIYSIDPKTGLLTQIGAVEIFDSPWRLIVDPSGRFLYVDMFNRILAFRINKDSGALTLIGENNVPGNGFNEILAIDPYGRFLYRLQENRDSVISIFQIDPKQGTLSDAGQFTSRDINLRGMAIDAEGTFLHVAGDGIDYFPGGVITLQIDPKTGMLAETSRTRGIYVPRGIALR